MSLFPRILPALRRMAQRFLEIEAQMSEPAVAADQPRVVALVRERGALEPMARAFREWERVEGEIAEALAEAAATGDLELRSFCAAIVDELRAGQAERESGLINDFVRDEDDAKDAAMLEIRAGVGGEEAALWAFELLRMYEGFCRRNGLTTELIDLQRAAAGGVKEAVLEVTGPGAFSLLRFESGGHRVQRVPATEAQGRVHTSAATVAVLPLVEEAEFALADTELRIETYRSGGPGGQHANKTSSAIRITHLPTGLVVTCQDERSQHRNKARALRVLRSRLQDAQRQRAAAARSEERAGLVGSGDRSDRIRTYNFPQSRVTDHRIDKTLHALDAVLAGDLDPLHEALLQADRAQRIEALLSRL